MECMREAIKMFMLVQSDGHGDCTQFAGLDLHVH